MSTPGLPLCPTHGIVESGHRCNEFDDMPWQRTDPSLEAETRNSVALESITAYCRSNPHERFWQALRNWSKFAFIVGLADREKPSNYTDTFNIEGLDGTRSASPLPTVAESLSVPPEALCVCGRKSMYHPVSGCEAFSPKLSASPQAQEPTP